MKTMTQTPPETDAPRIAAIIYRATDDADGLLADFAMARLEAGDRLGGIVQRNIKDGSGRRIDMQAIDLMTGQAIGISQTLGGGAGSCKLDASGLADSAQAVARAIADGVTLVIINKFSKQEATGHGLRSEFAETIVAGRPLLTAVPEKCLDAWRDFIGDQGVELPCTRDAVDAWWRDAKANDAEPRADDRVVSPASIG
jgi:nucleoside-triphosphatase THEP1